MPFEFIKKQLNDGKKVLVSGVPCQIQALSSYLGRKYEKLLLVDLLCYGVQSPLIWEKYLSEINPQRKSINSIFMRYKVPGWENYAIKIEYKDGSSYIKSRWKDPYLLTYAMDYVHLMTYAMVALILVGPEILKIFADQRYWEGMSIIPPIALANYMIFMYTMYVYIEHYYKKTVYITKNTLIAAGLNVILNFILIPKYGYVAAAYTTLASYFVAFILHSRYAKKIEPDIYPLKMFALPLLHVGGAIILYYPLLNFWTLRWGILFVYLIIVLIKERFRIGTLVPVLAEKCSFFKEK